MSWASSNEQDNQSSFRGSWGPRAETSVDSWLGPQARGKLRVSQCLQWELWGRAGINSDWGRALSVAGIPGVSHHTQLQADFKVTKEEATKAGRRGQQVQAPWMSFVRRWNSSLRFGLQPWAEAHSSHTAFCPRPVTPFIKISLQAPVLMVV